MLAPIQPQDSPSATDFEAILALARLEALTTLRRLLTDPPESPAAARELRMAASAILRIAPCLNEPRAPARGNRSESSEPRAPARGHVSEPNELTHTTAPDSAPTTIDPTGRQDPEETTRLSEPIRRPSRRDRRAAAALRARASRATQDSG